jgi:hypothetical protein
VAVNASAKNSPAAFASDKDEAIQEEVRNAARALLSAVHMLRKGRARPDEDLDDPRPKQQDFKYYVRQSPSWALR